MFVFILAKKYTMKLFTFLLVVCCFVFLASCVDRMDINDIVEGTPTRIDSVVKTNYVRPMKHEPVKKEAPGETE